MRVMFTDGLPEQAPDQRGGGDLRSRALTARHGLIDAFRHLYPHHIEHSWARRPDLGYRYDHAHNSTQLLPLLQDCEYVHQTRDVLADGSRLTDHSGLAVRLAMTAMTPLLTSDPATAVTSNNEPELEPTLF
jgi:exodeoxyribonuclease-3